MLLVQQRSALPLLAVHTMLTKHTPAIHRAAAPAETPILGCYPRPAGWVRRASWPHTELDRACLLPLLAKPLPERGPASSPESAGANSHDGPRWP